MTPEQIAPLATCFWIGAFTAYFAKKKKKKAGKWFALGFFVFGPIIYMGVTVLIAVICSVYYHRNASVALFSSIVVMIIGGSVCFLLQYRRQPSKKKLVVNFKKCPKCQASQDGSKEECPNCGEKIMTEVTEGPRGLGGWLILLAIVLLVSPIRTLITLNNDILPFFQESWQALTTPGSEAYHHLWAPLIVFEIVGNTIIIILNLILIFLFFTKSYRFPKLFIIFAISYLVFVVADFFFADLIPAVGEKNDPATVKELVRAIIGTAWIPYFMVSKRVKSTFVRPESNIALQPTQ